MLFVKLPSLAIWELLYSVGLFIERPMSNNIKMRITQKILQFFYTESKSILVKEIVKEYEMT